MLHLKLQLIINVNDISFFPDPFFALSDADKKERVKSNRIREEKTEEKFHFLNTIRSE